MERISKTVSPCGSGWCECHLWEECLPCSEGHLTPSFCWERKEFWQRDRPPLSNRMETWVTFSVLTLAEVDFPAMSPPFCPPPFHPSILSENIYWEPSVWLGVAHSSCPRGTYVQSHGGGRQQSKNHTRNCKIARVISALNVTLLGLGASRRGRLVGPPTLSCEWFFY